MKEHIYDLKVQWTGNTGSGTSGYRSYERSHVISADNKAPIEASSDPAFRGDPSKYNPEEFLVASISGCHMLWFLHLCSDSGIVVTSYKDSPRGIMCETADGGGRFTELILNPKVNITDPARNSELRTIHEQAHKLCYIANSVNFPVNISHQDV